LKEEKRGGGVTLPVDAFEGRNLVFVDEGHKGKGSEERVWARLRDALVRMVLRSSTVQLSVNTE